MEEEERKREQAKDSLAGMFPWETRDPDREILVEECKEAILALSEQEETFLGPYKMPALPKTNDDDEEVVEEIVPSEESLEKLGKLEPLPPLLADFDLDAHVGLIQRLLEVDGKLVEKQARLSGECLCRMPFSCTSTPSLVSVTNETILCNLSLYVRQEPVIGNEPFGEITFFIVPLQDMKLDSPLTKFGPIIQRQFPCPSMVCLLVKSLTTTNNMPKRL